jgi:putative ATP-dependent endonuclease of the OLD family
VRYYLTDPNSQTMYISKFSAFNYRSLKHVTIRLEDGKNVIVGKNNSGKSNIIKGLEVLVGERFPTYQNITDNDFYTFEEVDLETGELKEVVADHLYLEAELTGRDFDEALIKSIKKKTAFSKVTSWNALYSKSVSGEVVINFDFFQSLDEIEQRAEVEVLGQKRGGYDIKNAWKTPDEVLEFLKSAKIIKLFFCKSRLDEEKSGFGIICLDTANGIWVSNFLSKKLRDSLITTTVISALRSQKEDLRLVHYTWFGKLIMGLWEKYKKNLHPSLGRSYEDLIKEKSIDIKHFVDAVFDKDTKEIRKLLEGAIAHKTVSFKFMNDTKNELYKNVQLFVNDGIDRPLHEKGTGIQSAIIISLFSLYCDNFHNNSSLLITEEPELFLHPQARRVISAELDKFLVSSVKQPRQLIISTHSTEYLRNVDPYNIIRVYKDAKHNCSIAKQIDQETSQQITTELKRFLWSNNTELFFADKVVLVEGGEVYLIPSIVDKIKASKQLLDYQNITVSRVNGKGSFLTYVKMIQCFDIEYMILGDLDCFKDEVPKLIKHLNINAIKENAEKIRAAISALPISYEAIEERVKAVDKNHDAQALKSLFERFVSGEIERDNDELNAVIKFMQMRYTKGNKEMAIIESVGQQQFDSVLKILRESNIFIWSKGDLEVYYSNRAKELTAGKSKDIKALELSYLLQGETQSIDELLLHMHEVSLLVDSILPKP